MTPSIRPVKPLKKTFIFIAMNLQVNREKWAGYKRAMPDPVYYYILNQLKLPITTATEVRSDFSFLPYSNLQGMTVLGVRRAKAAFSSG